MRIKFFFLAITLFSIVFPFCALADGGVIRPLPEGDFVWVGENSQQAFINYEQGIEKLIVAIDIAKENSDIFWIMPVPSGPEKINIDITPELPFFYGDEVISKTKLELADNLEAPYLLGITSQ